MRTALFTLSAQGNSLSLHVKDKQSKEGEREMKKIMFAFLIGVAVLAGSATSSSESKSVPSSLIDTLTDPSFLTSIRKDLERPDEEQDEAILEAARKWLPALREIEAPHELLQIPWGDGSEIGNFAAFSTLIGILARQQAEDLEGIARNCHLEYAAMARAALEVNSARTNLATAQNELATADAEVAAAVAALTVAESNLASAQQAINDILPWTVLFGLGGGEAILFVAELYEAAFDQAAHNARARLENATQRATLLAQRVRFMEQALADARSAYADAWLAWLICMLGG